MDCKNIKKLNISFCIKIDADILKDICYLKELYTVGIQSMTETVFMNILNNNDLNIIDISMCNNISSSFIRSIKLSYKDIIIVNNN